MLLPEKLRPYRLILASQSPRRRELLTGCGLDYELAAPYPCAEIYPADLPAPEVPRYLSALKSQHYPLPLAPHDIIGKTKCDESQNQMRKFEGQNSPKPKATKISHTQQM